MVPTAEQFDLVVIGGGPGGYGAALYAASAGLSVAVVERDKVGGTCLHRGCIPAKEYLETASVYRTVSEAKDFGVGTSQPTLDFAVSQARKQKVVDGLWKGLSGLMKARKITVVSGTGALAPHRTVKVDDGSELIGGAVILAAGSVPRSLPGFDVDGKLVLTSDEVLSLESLPARAAVIGGGAIGCEFASCLADLGTQVTLLEGLERILFPCDRDVSDAVAKSFKRRGIDVRAGVTVKGHAPNGNGTTLAFDDETIDVDCIVMSVGRRPRTEDLLEPGTSVVVDERGFVVVDEHLRTGEDRVWAVGDVVATPGVPHPQLAHVGFADAIAAVKDVLGEPAPPVDYVNVPWCIYSHPEVAFAGLTEQAARDAGHDVVVAKHRFTGNGRALILGDADGLVKVIAEKDGDGRAGRILGVHMVGPWVTEQLGQAYLTVNWEASVDEVAQFVQPHPTLSEVFGETVLSLTGRGLHG